MQSLARLSTAVMNSLQVLDYSWRTTLTISHIFNKQTCKVKLFLYTVNPLIAILKSAVLQAIYGIASQIGQYRNPDTYNYSLKN